LLGKFKTTPIISFSGAALGACPRICQAAQGFSDNGCLFRFSKPTEIPMKITKNSAVTVRYKVSNAQGKVLEESQEPMAYLHGGYGNLFPKVEEALEGQEVGFKVLVELSADDAFGQRDEALLQTIPKTQFPPGVKVGGQIEGQDAQGHSRAFTVLKIKGDQVMLDGNHPLAGQALRFQVQVIEVRAASEEEVAHGHVHGAHGHHH
jgi:FKBP-type peptidyl-prolyl cis-trans isomerase SlyD